MSALTRTSHHTHCPYKGDATYWTIRGGERVSENAVWSYETPFASMAQIKGYLSFYPDRVDSIEELAGWAARRSVYSGEAGRGPGLLHEDRLDRDPRAVPAGPHGRHHQCALPPHRARMRQRPHHHGRDGRLRAPHGDAARGGDDLLLSGGAAARHAAPRTRPAGPDPRRPSL